MAKDLGIDLGLKPLEQIGLAGEVAAKIGEAQARSLRDLGEGDLIPAAFGSELESRPNGAVTVTEIVQHGESSFAS